MLHTLNLIYRIVIPRGKAFDVAACPSNALFVVSFLLALEKLLLFFFSLSFLFFFNLRKTFFFSLEEEVDAMQLQNESWQNEDAAV